MMNKSLRGGDRESSHKVCYGFHELRSFDNRRTSAQFRACCSVFGRSEYVRVKKTPQNENPEPGSDAIRTEKLFRTEKVFGRADGLDKKEPPFPAAFEVVTGRRQTEWTGATRCPKRTLKLIIEKA
jgi:hypothetical protein